MIYEKCVILPYPDYEEFMSQCYNNIGFRKVSRHLMPEDLYIVPEDWFEGVFKKLYGNNL